ncbi:hypothetical protein Q3C01_08645 [Bradyrhizobium sp. UFLA05-109]
MRQFVGKVTKGPFAAGSKSERNAIRLETAEGSYVLRREGGNPLHDPALEDLVGKSIECQGETHDYTLTMRYWKIA